MAAPPIYYVYIVDRFRQALVVLEPTGFGGVHASVLAWRLAGAFRCRPTVVFHLALHVVMDKAPQSTWERSVKVDQKGSPNPYTHTHSESLFTGNHCSWKKGWYMRRKVTERH